MIKKLLPNAKITSLISPAQKDIDCGCPCADSDLICRYRLDIDFTAGITGLVFKEADRENNTTIELEGIQGPYIKFRKALYHALYPFGYDASDKSSVSIKHNKETHKVTISIISELELISLVTTAGVFGFIKECTKVKICDHFFAITEGSYSLETVDNFYPIAFTYPDTEANIISAIQGLLPPDATIGFVDSDSYYYLNIRTHKGNKILLNNKAPIISNCVDDYRTTDPISPFLPKLSLAKSPGIYDAQTKQVSYIVTLSSIGQVSTTSSTVLMDGLPAGCDSGVWTLLSDPIGSMVTSGTMPMATNIPSGLLPGTSLTFHVKCNVKTILVQSGGFVGINTVTASGGGQSSNLSAHAPIVPIPIGPTPLPIITLVKSAGLLDLAAKTVTYNITVANIGSVDATSVIQLLDNLPENINTGSWTLLNNSGGVVPIQNGSMPLSLGITSLASGGSVTLEIVVAVPDAFLSSGGVIGENKVYASGNNIPSTLFAVAPPIPIQGSSNCQENCKIELSYRVKVCGANSFGGWNSQTLESGLSLSTALDEAPNYIPNNPDDPAWLLGKTVTTSNALSSEGWIWTFGATGIVVDDHIALEGEIPLDHLYGGLVEFVIKVIDGCNSVVSEDAHSYTFILGDYSFYVVDMPAAHVDDCFVSVPSNIPSSDADFNDEHDFYHYHLMTNTVLNYLYFTFNANNFTLPPAKHFNLKSFYQSLLANLNPAFAGRSPSIKVFTYKWEDTTYAGFHGTTWRTGLVINCKAKMCDVFRTTFVELSRTDISIKTNDGSGTGSQFTHNLRLIEDYPVLFSGQNIIVDELFFATSTDFNFYDPITDLGW